MDDEQKDFTKLKMSKGLTRSLEREICHPDRMTWLAGVDEVGRGPLAGPVVAAAVMFAPDLPDEALPLGICDSKKLSGAQRVQVFEHILRVAHIGIASLPAQEIDATNIRLASLKAMAQAVAALEKNPDFVIVDGRDVPDLDIPMRAIIKGDSTHLSIAAASIVAKVIRDRQMSALAQAYPVYGFDQHMGYGTLAHRSAITLHGPCPFHRYTFSPMKGHFSR